MADGEGFEFVNKIKGGVIPSSFIPAVEKGVKEAMKDGVVAGYPLRDIRVTLYDGSYHSVDSSEMAFKIAGSMAFKKAAEQAQPALLEPIMQAQVSVPEDAVGDVIGDLNGRRGRPLGMEPKGAMTEIKAEVPMAEMLNYAPDLRSITGGRGDYTMEFLRYEEVPAHLAQKVISAAGAAEEAAYGPEHLEHRFHEARRFVERKETAQYRGGAGVRGLWAHDAQGRAGRALPDPLARAAHGLHAVRAARAAGGLDPRVGRARDADPPAAHRRPPRHPALRAPPA